MAKVTKGSDGWEAEAVLGILRQGQWFGEIELIDGLPPFANVTAMEPMECCFLPRETFMSALENNPEIAVGLLPGLGTMVRNADQWIAQLL
jgi:CRP-like cAMP-binding protein